jgi:hypothetical protein
MKERFYSKQNNSNLASSHGYALTGLIKEPNLVQALISQSSLVLAEQVSDESRGKKSGFAQT